MEVAWRPSCWQRGSGMLMTGESRIHQTREASLWTARRCSDRAGGQGRRGRSGGRGGPRAGGVDRRDVGRLRDNRGRHGLRWHHHGDYELTIYVLSGALRMEFGPAGHEVIDAEPGDFLYVAPHAIHREGNPTDDKATLVVHGPGRAIPSPTWMDRPPRDLRLKIEVGDVDYVTSAMHRGAPSPRTSRTAPGTGSGRRQRVGPALELLRPHGFEVLHEVSWPGRRQPGIDHVVVGPSGVFVVDTQNWSGAVTVQAETLSQNGYSRVQQTEAAHRSALVVGLSLGASWAALVVPVICLIGSAELAPTQAGPVTVLSLDHLTPWLLVAARPVGPAGVKQVLRSLRVALPGEPRWPARLRHLLAFASRKSRRRAPVQIERRAVPRREAEIGAARTGKEEQDRRTTLSISAWLVRRKGVRAATKLEEPSWPST